MLSGGCSPEWPSWGGLQDQASEPDSHQVERGRKGLAEIHRLTHNSRSLGSTKPFCRGGWAGGGEGDERRREEEKQAAEEARQKERAEGILQAEAEAAALQERLQAVQEEQSTQGLVYSLSPSLAVWAQAAPGEKKRMFLAGTCLKYRSLLL